MRPVVLMSTYNGAAYLRQQVESIVHQLPPNGLLCIRDDGSTDNTLEVLHQLAANNIKITAGENIGFARSFLSLLSDAPDDATMYMLADQDDLWLPWKIERAAHWLSHRKNQAALYCSNAIITDENLTPIGKTKFTSPHKEWHHAFTENVAIGCTIAISPRLRELAKGSESSNLIRYHDWWLYILAKTYGDVMLDPEHTLLYRQHGNNSVGMKPGIKRYTTIAKNLAKTNWLKSMNSQIWEFKKSHSDAVSEQQLKQLENIQDTHGRLRRMKIIFSRKILRSSVTSEILFRSLVAFDLRDPSPDK